MYVFFYKQKTAYEVRISDWSSDVCSSELHPAAHQQRMRMQGKRKWRAQPGIDCGDLQHGIGYEADQHDRDQENRHEDVDPAIDKRTEERRVGKEWVRTCRSRWSPCH